MEKYDPPYNPSPLDAFVIWVAREWHWSDFWYYCLLILLSKWYYCLLIKFFLIHHTNMNWQCWPYNNVKAWNIRVLTSKIDKFSNNRCTFSSIQPPSGGWKEISSFLIYLSSHKEVDKIPPGSCIWKFTINAQKSEKSSESCIRRTH